MTTVEKGIPAMHTPRMRRPLSLLVSAVAVGGLAMVGAVAPAAAAPQDFGNIDVDRTGSITVHKFLNQDGDVVGDPSSAPAAGDFTDPVADVEFTVYPLLEGGAPIDLGDPASWDGLDSLTPGAACTAPAGYTLGAPMAMPLTDGSGASTISLPVGVYQVCETAAPANIVERSAPFIVAIPLPYEQGWVYDVQVYPKNGAAELEKTVTPQQDLGLGAVINFPVSVAIPRLANEWTGLAIRDSLDPRLNPVDPADVVVTVDGTPLDPSFYEVTVDGQTVTFDLTAAGLAWLNEGPNAHVGEVITVTFAGVVVEVGDGSISNSAELWTNNPGFDPDGNPPLPSNEVVTHWGDLGIVKRAAGTTGAEGLLAGAEFQVYAADDPYAADCSTVTATGAPLSVAGETTFTTNAAGVIEISGLFVSDSANPVIDSPQRCYVLAEITAPAGYVLPADPFTPVAVLIGETTVDDVEIVNTQQSVPALPLTGGAGQALLILAGMGAIAVAVGIVIVRRRRMGVHAA